MADAVAATPDAVADPDATASTTAASRAEITEKVTVSPAEFSFVKFDAAEIGEVVVAVAALVGVPNPIHVEVDETTPLARLMVQVDGTSSDDQVTILAESGALENSQRPTFYGAERTAVAVGRMLLRARDRMRPDFADVAPDHELSVEELAAWDTYCAGRLSRLGYEMNQQRWRYNHRNRFGFTDDTDAAFDRLWAAEDIGWSEVLDP
jgi:hypothetical protein